MAGTDSIPSLGQRNITIVRCDTGHIPNDYDMSHIERGVAIVINNRNFTTLGLGSRGGTEADGESVADCLGDLGFQVRTYMNQTKLEMKNIMERAAHEDHSDRDCFACVIMSHGEQDTVYGTDGPVELGMLLDPFKGHRSESLTGKPKLFFIQACRGDNRDYGADVTDAAGTDDHVGDDGDDEESVTYRIPTEADFLVAYSVTQGYYSWRHRIYGSLFIQALCEVLQKDGTDLDLMTLLTRVNKTVAYGFEIQEVQKAKTCAGHTPFVYRMKQMPSVLSTLTKDVFFRPKR